MLTSFKRIVRPIILVALFACIVGMMQSTYAGPHSRKTIREISSSQWGKLVTAVKNKPDMSSQDVNIIMMGELYRLEAWYAVMLGSTEKKNLRPYTGVIDKTSALMLFTSIDLAQKFAEKSKLTNHKDGFSIGSYKVPDTFKELQAFESQGVKMVRFNEKHPVGGWQSPIGLLQAGYEWHLKNDKRFKE